MARACVDNARQSLAVIAILHHKVLRVYRNTDTFPWLALSRNDPVPAGSTWYHRPLGPSDFSEIDECDPEIWLSPREALKVEVVREQALGQRDGFGLILLHAELRDDDDDGLEPTDTRWR